MNDTGGWPRYHKIVTEIMNCGYKCSSGHYLRYDQRYFQVCVNDEFGDSVIDILFPINTSYDMAAAEIEEKWAIYLEECLNK